MSAARASADSVDALPAQKPAQLRWLGQVDYEPTWRAMQALT